MTSSLAPRRPSPVMDAVSTRRRALGLLGAGALTLGLDITPVAAIGQPSDDGNVLNEAAVLRDPDIPVAGNA
ncbi:MAG: Twin-arginine translocation pathway signal, partial [Tardiphaga sp.]|nr:Twin-arginine translocation pathway signal [Tardiphaga sp.]